VTSRADGLRGMHGILSERYIRVIPGNEGLSTGHRCGVESQGLRHCVIAA
jgi:hypothetical protein